MEIQRIKKYGTWIGKVIVLIFACIGLLLTGGFFAVKWGVTNIPGAIDLNDRFFSKERIKSVREKDGINQEKENIHCVIGTMIRLAPYNGAIISQVYNTQRDEKVVRRMVNALKLSLGENAVDEEIKKTCSQGNDTVMGNSGNVFAWMQTDEWASFHDSVKKDTKMIQDVATKTGVPARMIVAQLVGEQMRLYFTDRELFKSVFAPLKILGSETQFSLGVSGIKEETAIRIENNLKDSQSPFYPGKEYENLLAFKTDSISNERIERITDSHNHYYAYMYTALFIKEIMAQWNNAGFDISQRPEIIATIFNLGFNKSHPNASPQVGGAKIDINGTSYTFGALAYEFYYSGDLYEEFPVY